MWGYSLSAARTDSDIHIGSFRHEPVRKFMSQGKYGILICTWFSDVQYRSTVQILDQIGRNASWNSFHRLSTRCQQRFAPFSNKSNSQSKMMMLCFLWCSISSQKCWMGLGQSSSSTPNWDTISLVTFCAQRKFHSESGKGQKHSLDTQLKAHNGIWCAFFFFYFLKCGICILNVITY